MSTAAKPWSRRRLPQSNGKTVHVAVDAMGSDRAPGPEVAGALRAVRSQAVRVTLVGDAAVLELELSRAGGTADDAISIVHASEVVTMDDHPAQVKDLP